MRLEQDWMCYAGIELVNSQRALTYLRQGLGGPSWSVRASGADPWEPEGLACYCPLVADDTYTGPSQDPAPWYDAMRPDSADFLGLVGGVELAQTQNGTQVVVFNGTAFAASGAGLHYGERWITEVLRGNVRCDTCPKDTVEVLPYCDADAFRQLHKATVIDGPLFAQPDGVGCKLQGVSFQIESSLAYLFSRGDTIYNVTLDPGEQQCELVEVPTWPGDVAMRVQITAPDDGAVSDITVKVTPTNEFGCPDDQVAPCATFTIASLPASQRVTVDARTRTVTKWNPSSKLEEAGYDLLTFDGAFPWPEVGSCARACVCVSIGSGSAQEASVLVQTFAREV